MESLQLQESIQNLIRQIRLKNPKAEQDILHLRAVFIESVRALNKDYWKLVKKYEKVKEKLFDNKQQPNGKRSSNQFSQLKSPRQSKVRGMQQSQSLIKRYSDYDSDLMSVILSEAKKIKQTFQQTIHSTAPQYHPSSISSIFNTYKQFYKLFKHRHKQYLQGFSYDEKHIHKNSTQMKERLLQELKNQIAKKKLLEQKLETFQLTVQKKIKRKNKQIQRLKQNLQVLKNQLTSNGILYQQKDYELEKKQFKLLSEGDNNKRANNAKINLNFKNKDHILQSRFSDQVNNDNLQRKKSVQQPISRLISDSKSYDIDQGLNSYENYSDSQQEMQNNTKQEFQDQLSQSLDETDSYQNQLNSQQNKKSSWIPNESSLGMFQLRPDFIKNGKLNTSQINKSKNQNQDENLIRQKRSSKSGDLYFEPQKQYQSRDKRRQPNMMTFGQHLQLQNKQGNEQSKGDKDQQMRQKIANKLAIKNLQRQLDQLRQQLQKQKMQKQKLKSKLKSSDAEYKKLQDEVNQLYKMIDEKQQLQRQQPKQFQEISVSNGNTQNENLVNFRKNSPLNSKNKQEKPNQSNKSLNQNYNQTSQDFDECQDIEDVIKKAQNSFLNKNNQKQQKFPQNVFNSSNNYQISFGDVISPISKKNPYKNEDLQADMNKQFYPPKNNSGNQNQKRRQNKFLSLQMPDTPKKSTNNGQNLNIDQVKSPSNKNNNFKSIKNDQGLNEKENQNDRSRLNMNKSQFKQQSQLELPPTNNKQFSNFSIRSYSNTSLTPSKNLPPMESRLRLQNQMKAQLEQIQQYYADRLKEKDEQAQVFQGQAKKQKMKSNSLMMMLLLQAVSLQQFIAKQEQYKNHLKNQF